MRGKRKFKAKSSVPFKKRAVEENVDVESEGEDNNIIEEHVSSFTKLLNSLPSTNKNQIKNTVSKPKAKPITKEEQEIELDSRDSLPKWNTLKDPDHKDDTADQIEDEESEGESNEMIKGESGESETENEEIEDLVQKTEEITGEDHSSSHFNLELSTEQIELLSKKQKHSFSKCELLSELNQLLDKKVVSSEPANTLYCPSSDEFDHSNDNPIHSLFKEDAINARKLKKDHYRESIEDIYMKKKLKDGFHTGIGKLMKDIAKNRKRLLSYHEEYFELPSSVELYQTFCSLFPVMDQYYDVLYSLETLFNPEIIRMSYMLHVMNHTIKSRDIVIKNSLKIRELERKEKEIKKEMKFIEKEYYATNSNSKKRGRKHPPELQEKLDIKNEILYKINEEQGELNDSCKDQGFTRPKTLILVPSQETAGFLIECIISLFPVSQIHHRKRFYEYFLPSDRDLEPHKLKSPEYNAMFYGNTNDTFYICCKVAQRALKLYADPYDSDIIIASPIGLRAMIDKKKESRGRHDFLSSIEICVLDMADVFLMQNWSHIEFIFKHLNEIPELSRDTDFSRVKPYFLEGWSKYYRQNLIFSRMLTPELLALFNRNCFNYQGKLRFQKNNLGIIPSIKSPIPQKFEKVLCNSLADLHDTRFNHFIHEIFPRFRSSVEQSHTLIYIPSYFDFVRVRNHFKQERYSFVSINEYTDSSEIARSRLAFFEGKTEYLLVTERFYFFMRYRIRGAKKLIFYAPPLDPQFYNDFVSLVDDEGTSLLSYVAPFDQLALQRIVGNKRCRKMISSPKNSHVLVS